MEHAIKKYIYIDNRAGVGAESYTVTSALCCVL
jgi:hypothetical protein